MATTVVGALVLPLAFSEVRLKPGATMRPKSDLRPDLRALHGQLRELLRLPGSDRNIHANAVAMHRTITGAMDMAGLGPGIGTMGLMAKDASLHGYTSPVPYDILCFSIA
jgi:hypothetical protein